MTDPARSRFFLISAVRLAGATLMLVGLVIAYRRWEGLPPITGIAVTLLGALGFAVMPRLLAWRWKSRP